MRRIVTWDLMTLDGCFEGATPWSLEFHMTVWGDELETYSLKQLDEVGTLLFGRKTFEGMADYWSGETGAIADRMNAVEKIAATRNGTTKAWPNTRVLQGDISDHIEALKAEDGKDIFVFGSSDLMATLLEKNAVDEIRLCLVPVVLGGGNPLFKSDGVRKDFQLIESRPFTSGGLLLRYARADA
ncbi:MULTISPECIES: dihydrofolate reductase family protein [unclassified Roseitalea]|uniref:dihydrofolate reductase family protein n=1 Tax=unclassified Roseitalea TaxID=2639107 RepID=UPI00273E4439|nr:MULTISPECIES: dihydrofolate reductase family protein [unclassified Roseitalea]